MIKVTRLEKEVVVINYGDAFDYSKAVSPYILKVKDFLYYLYYVGSNCQPTKREGYRLLVAKSNDGVLFQKVEKPILQIRSNEQKQYSPAVIYTNNKYVMFYGLGADGKYVIKSAESKNGLHFEENEEILININTHHKASAHSPKIFKEGKYIHCYYTGSHNKIKIYSKKYPKYEFGTNFNLFYTKFDLDLHKDKIQQIKFEMPKIINYYGHSVYHINNTVYMIFTGFDGSINRLYFATSYDKIHFSAPQMILEPQVSEQELGIYSSSFLPIAPNEFRLFYGVRYFNNHWNIKSAKLKITE